MNYGYNSIPDGGMLREKKYNKEHAVAYARRWALSRNPLFSDYTGRGGDCTNFVSQCVLAGSCTMNFEPTFGWYFLTEDSRAPAWTGVEAFNKFMTGDPFFVSKNGGTGPYASVVRRRDIIPGDVIQLKDEAGDLYHTLLVSLVDDNDIYVCAHSDDSLDRGLSTYNFASAIFLHIRGVREYGEDDYCFDELIEGIKLPSE